MEIEKERSIQPHPQKELLFFVPAPRVITPPNNEKLIIFPKGKLIYLEDYRKRKKNNFFFRTPPKN